MKMLDFSTDNYSNHQNQRVVLADDCNRPFSESEILDLQEMFLTTGFHIMVVKNLLIGRSIIQKLLTSLNYYHEIGYLSVSSCELEEHCTNLYSSLIDFGCFDEFSQYNFDAYFIDQFYIDFLVIECTQSLLALPWYQYFEASLKRHKIDRKIPIILVTYGDN